MFRKMAKLMGRQFLNQRELNLQNHVMQNSSMWPIFVQILPKDVGVLDARLVELDACSEKCPTSRGDNYLTSEADTSNLLLAKLQYVTNVCTKFQKNRTKTVGVTIQNYLNLTHVQNKSCKLSQDTPVLPQVVKLGHAPNKIQVWKTTKGTNSKIKQARVMIPVHCTSPLWDLSTHEIS